MIYIFTDGRIAYNSSFIQPEDFESYIEVESLPVYENVEGKYCAITGCNVATGEIFSEYFDLPEEQIEPTYPEPEPTAPEPTDLEILMQAQADAELRDFAIQQGQEILAQQMADIELAVLGGAV